ACRLDSGQSHGNNNSAKRPPVRAPKTSGGTIAMGAEPLLRIDNVSVRFGGVRALDGVTCQVNAGEICGLIGPNGAGKTTLFNCITRLYPVAGGAISFCGERIDGAPARRII